MRRSASEILRNLEMRVARLEKQSAPKGKGQIAIMERLQVMGIGEHYFNDVVSGLRVNYGSLQSAAKALHNKGLVKVDNPNVPLMIQLTEKGEQMRVARLEKQSANKDLFERLWKEREKAKKHSPSLSYGKGKGGRYLSAKTQDMEIFLKRNGFNINRFEGISRNEVLYIIEDNHFPRDEFYVFVVTEREKKYDIDKRQGWRIYHR